MCNPAFFCREIIQLIVENMLFFKLCRLRQSVALI
ncbi:hypothetical protein PSYAC_17161 [Pseudomonas syringae pv. actinidiae str. M302091]|nr:hypothetical protein PSYAC_17161 [Pseudomonas syringae pv. actinidiae str. M302091]